MKAIVAVDKNWGIGKDNGLLFFIPEDMKFFRQTTLNKVVVMGSNTLKSFPNGSPLKNRTNVVLSKTVSRDDCTVIDDLQRLLQYLKQFPSDDVYVIGGAMLYRTLLPYCAEALVTKVNADGDADTFFENLDALPNWTCAEQSQPVETNGITIKFTKYVNSCPLSL